MPADRAQATVEFALLIPAIGLMVLLVAQVIVLGRDRIVLVHACREAARSAMVHADARRWQEDAAGVLGSAADRFTVSTEDGTKQPGELLTVHCQLATPTQVPVVGRFFPEITMTDSFVIRVESRIA